jgi:hypothetical protein
MSTTPPLTLGALTGDSLQAVATYLATNANSIAAAGDAFIQGLAASKETDFADIGDLPTLDWLSVNFDQELNLVRDLRTTPPIINLTDLGNRIDQLAALVTPVAPDLATPTVVIPQLSAVRPTIELPAQPNADVGTAPTDAPNLTEVVAPDAPLVTLPNAPTFEEFAIPVMPTFTIPTFQGALPQNQLLAPTMAFSYVDTGYTSALGDPIVAKLLDGLTNGGYGIEPSDEAALWSRARDRAEQQAKAQIQEVARKSVNTSFPMPQGAYFQQVASAQQKLQDTLSEVNRDITLRRSELYVENRKFTIQQAQEYEKIAIGLYNAVQERALNFAKATVELGVMVYEAGVKNFQMQLESYKAEAAVFEARTRAELTKAEIFKSQIEAEKLRGEFNQIKVNLYNGQVQAIQTVVNLYKSRVEAATLQSQLQQQRLEVFRARVSSYAERVRAKSAEYEMYRAATAGELAKLDMYKTEIEAYSAQVGAEEAQGRLTLQSNEALLQRFKAAVTAYEANLAGLSKVVDARLATADTQVKAYATDVEVYRSYVNGLIESARTRVAQQEMNNRWNIATMNSRVEQVKFRLEELRATVDNMNNINRFGADYFRTALGATLAGLNGLSVKSTSG